MQLVPLSPGGRVTAVAAASLPPGPLQVALRVRGEAVVIEALGPLGPSQVGRLFVADSAAYRPVLVRLAARGHTGTCPALVARTGDATTLTLHLGPPSTCVPHEVPCAAPTGPRQRTPAALARTVRLAAAVPAVRCPAPRRPRPDAVPRPRPAAPSIVPRNDEQHPRPSAPRRRSPLPARPPARFGQLDDPAPRLTRSQRRRVLWVTAGLAGVLLLVSLMQSGTTTSAHPAAATAPVTCRPDGTATCPDARP
jgi:hypothetical protein